MRRAILTTAALALLAPLPLHARAQDGPPPSEPRWLKGNLHTHTLWSDGNDYPEMVVDWYARNGYHFLALSDHNVLSQGRRWIKVAEADRRAGNPGFERYLGRFGTEWVETRGAGDAREVRLKPLGEFRTLFERPGAFLMIQGEEITDSFGRKPIHMNATNLAEFLPPAGGDSVVEVMANNLDAAEAQARRLGQPILAHLNHPNFGYAVTAEELAMVTKERFFEVYNGHPGVNQPGDATHASIERMWDIVNTLRLGELDAPPVYGLATDDSHNYFGDAGASVGRGWVMVRARFLTPESVIKAIEAADFYASSGVELADLRFNPEARTLAVEVAPREGARHTIRFVGTPKGYDRTRRPVADAEGNPLPVTRRYSDDVGKVFAEVEGDSATYRLTGEELYVRAVVTSDRPPANPSYEGQLAQAWTQPVGWEAALEGRRREARGGRPAIRKLGTIDAGLVEATPVVFRDRLYRFEYVRPDYAGNDAGDSYFRLVDAETGAATPAFARGYDLGCAYEEGGVMWAFGVDHWDGSKVVGFRSEDLETWEEVPAMELPGWGLFNTSVCKAGDRYVMAIEVGRPAEVVGVPFTTRFAESKDLRSWSLLPEDCVFTKNRYSACPTIRHLDGLFYMTYLEAKPGPSYETHVVRSPDLVRWERSPLGPVLAASDEDRQIANPSLSEDMRAKVGPAVDRNNSDLDFCEFRGRTVLTYSWGDQQGNEFLAEAVYDGPVAEFLRGFFPEGGPATARGRESAAGRAVPARLSSGGSAASGGSGRGADDACPR